VAAVRCGPAAGLGADRLKICWHIVEKMEDNPVMKDATKRSFVRWIHIVFAIPIIGYIYSPFDKIPNYAPPTRFVFVPVMLLSGLWMWKGHVVRRLFSNRSA
jgi:hypothetical protein